jgi:hypothetical protein
MPEGGFLVRTPLDPALITEAETIALKARHVAV